MKRYFSWILMSLLAFSFVLSCVVPKQYSSYLFQYARSRQNDLRLSIYITAQAVNNQLGSEEGRRAAVSLLQSMGITKAYVEVYRSGLVVDEELLRTVRKYFEKADIDVAGGIATVPGRDFGVRQQGQLGWFNWQNPKTQNDLKRVVVMAAGVFDEFIIDDFLCTADTSLESKKAKGDKSWSQYRRDLLTRLAREIFIEPAKKVNPNITMIIKFPQWYDRFHLFGYDVAREPELFDRVWVGTETRGQYTQRYGFVQPYEGFVNYRWFLSLAGDKVGGAWFDHGDCNAIDFMDQAYQSVLAGAREIIIFNYQVLVNGHPAHHLLRRQFHKLADLAQTVREHPVTGVVGYKPPNSDAGGDLYIMDFIGMLGIPLVPDAAYPDTATVVFLPTQAAADEDILGRVQESIKNGATVVMTAGFLATAKEGQRLAQLAGIGWPVRITPMNAKEVYVNGVTVPVKYGLDLEARLTLQGSRALLLAKVGNSRVPFLTEAEKGRAKIYVLNTHTFSQADFDAVGEVLLCPRPLGLLEIPAQWANTLRRAFVTPLGLELEGPTRITLQPLKGDGWFIHNYNQQPEKATFRLLEGKFGKLADGLTGQEIEVRQGSVVLDMPARSRIWIRQ